MNNALKLTACEQRTMIELLDFFEDLDGKNILRIHFRHYLKSPERHISLFFICLDMVGQRQQSHIRSILGYYFHMFINNLGKKYKDLFWIQFTSLLHKNRSWKCLNEFLIKDVFNHAFGQPIYQRLLKYSCGTEATQYIHTLYKSGHRPGDRRQETHLVLHTHRSYSRS